MIKTVDEIAEILDCYRTTVNIFFGSFRLSKYVLGRNQINWTDETPRDLLEFLKTKRQKQVTLKYIARLKEYIDNFKVEI